MLDFCFVTEANYGRQTHHGSKSFTQWSAHMTKLGNTFTVLSCTPHRKLDDCVSNVDTFKRELSLMVQDNKKISAIKILRSVTGWDLKSSKDFVDSL